ncbi:hypothetical protein B7R22_16955 [Subtercola boreus]|uniref:Rad50/SbcC-type AAA domain-containing protein n=1 Tax=Subtercola boreus TaxID=120213 RepID=A0A3E0VRD1_9MICO|nr:hypothetical protein [Subtercola boreus]RFA12120.1 hypothetical protein B7R22_16955 [Subtercola boreus]
MAKQTVTSISVRNYKGVKEITVSPEGSYLVVIAGGNGQGKTSFMDAVGELIDPKGVKLTTKPIREGESEAFVELTTNVAKVRRVWKKDDAGTMSAFALDGAKYPSGKDFVVKATGGVLFDPYEFVGLKETEQRAKLLRLVELPFDLDELNRTYAGAFTRRTDKKKDLARVTTALGLLAKPDDDTPPDELSAADIMAELETARRANDEFDKLVASKTEMSDRVAKLEALLVEARAALAFTEKAIAKHPGKVDTSAIVARLESLQQINASVRGAQQYRAALAAVDAETAAVATLDAEIDAVEAKKRAGLAAAKFPVDGLGIDDDGVTFTDRPFKNLNEAEATVVAFDLATLPQPDLRLVVIKNGNDLAPDTVERIREKCEERGYLALMERIVLPTDQAGIVIVEGEVAA